MKTLLTNTVVVSLFYLTAFVDVFSGVLILGGILPEGGAGSPSQLFRFFLLFLLFRVAMLSRRFFYNLSFFIIYILSVELISFLFHQSAYGLIIGLIYGGKIIYLLLVYYALKVLVYNQYLTTSRVKKHIKRYILLTSLLLLLPFFLNIGNSTYLEGTFGFKGFFSSGNGLGVFLGVSSLLLIYHFKIHKSYYSFLRSIITLFATLIVGSKTALFFFVTGISTLLFSIKRYLSILFMVMGGLVLIYYLPSLINTFGVVFDVIVFRFNNADNFFSFIMSNRDVYFLDAIENYRIDGFLFFRIFFGFGVYTSFRDPSNHYLSFDTLESDFADLFFMYGLFSLLIYFSIILYFGFIGLRKRKYFLSIIFIFLIFHSLFAGHVILNSMSGVMLPLIAFLMKED